MRITTLLVLSLAIIPASVRASWVDFEPIQSLSPDGKLYVNARFYGVTEWQNTAKTVPANGSMRYQMTDAKSNTLWITDIPIDADFSSFDTPAEIFVSMNAWAVVRTYSSDLLCFNPKGERTVKLDIIDTLLPDVIVHDDFFSWTSAGRKWGQLYAHYYFCRHLDQLYFVIRTYWDDRLVVRLSDGISITPDAGLSTALLTAETEFVTQTLKDAVRNKDLEHASWETIRAIITAVHMAGRMRMKKITQLLQQLESVEYSPGWGFYSSKYKPPAGFIDPAIHSALLLRQVVHLSLRRLGDSPRVFPCVRFAIEGTDPPKWLNLPDLAAPREQCAQALKPGLSPDAVIRLVGGPDFVDWGKHWEYDIDARVPYTLTLTWGEHILETISTNHPVIWQQMNKRDRQILE